MIVALPGLAAEKESTPADLKQVPIAKKILFVGNSFTYWNKGLWHHMEQLVQCRLEKLDFKAEHVVRGGGERGLAWHLSQAHPNPKITRFGDRLYLPFDGGYS